MHSIDLLILFATIVVIGILFVVGQFPDAWKSVTKCYNTGNTGKTETPKDRSVFFGKWSFACVYNFVHSSDFSRKSVTKSYDFENTHGLTRAKHGQNNYECVGRVFLLSACCVYVSVVFLTNKTEKTQVTQATTGLSGTVPVRLAI